jgi:sugar lactone lactonase YvrE
VAVDRAGDVYVADSGTGRIEKLSQQGGPSGQWTNFGSVFSGSPQDVAVDDHSNVYVADNTNDRVQELSPSGAIIGNWNGTKAGAGGSAPVSFHGPEGVAVDAHGSIYVADSGNNRIVKLSPAGTVVSIAGGSGSRSGELNGPTGIAVDIQGDLYVADTGNNRVVRFTPKA